MKVKCNKCGAKLQKQKFGFLNITVCRACGPEAKILNVLFNLFVLMGPSRTIKLQSSTQTDLVRALKLHPEYSDKKSVDLLEIVRASGGNNIKVKISSGNMSLYKALLAKELPSVKCER